VAAVDGSTYGIPLATARGTDSGVIPDSGHSISEIEQSRLDLRAFGEWALKLSRMILAIKSPQPYGTRFGLRKEEAKMGLAVN
jgi:hypothetical protein